MSVEQKLIEAFFAQPDHFVKSAEHIQAVEDTLAKLDRGEIRVCNKVGADWQLNDWVKKAVLLYFRIRKVEKMEFGSATALDKIPLKQWKLEDNVRVVPGATARYGSFVSPTCVLMPSYVNVGAYVGEGTMVDTWATVGSCAQIGKGVHMSGGVGVGGVLEPVQAAPVIIEDHCFLGSRAIVVEGVRVCESAVLGANVVLTASTPIIDVRGKEEKIYKGIVPPRCVVVPGTRKKTFPAGDYYLTCALIIGERSASTDQKTSLNSALRDYDVSV